MLLEFFSHYGAAFNIKDAIREPITFGEFTSNTLWPDWLISDGNVFCVCVYVCAWMGNTSV